MNEEFEEILEKLDLTSAEARVYLALLTLKASQTGGLCKETGIASSNIYNILDSLIKKGLTSYKVHNNIKIFMPANPETLNELFSEKQKKLAQDRFQIQNLVKNLKTEKQEESYSNYKYYEGLINVKSMWHEINESIKNEYIIKCYTCKFESAENLIGFYEEHHKIRVKKRINAQLIFPIEEKGSTLAEKRKKQLADIKFLDLKNDAEWGVIGDMVYIQYVTGKVPRAFMIKDKIFASTYEQSFDQLWQIAKK